MVNSTASLWSMRGNMEVVSKNNADHYIWGNICDGWHLAKSKGLSVIQESVPSGCSEIKHLHQQSEQFFFVLSGKATLEADENIYVLEKHEGLHIPANIAHQLKNNDKSDLVFLVISTPPSHGDRVEVLP